MRFISSLASWNSKTSMFPAMCSGRTGFGMTTTPRSIRRRRTPWATLLPGAVSAGAEGLGGGRDGAGRAAPADADPDGAGHGDRGAERLGAGEHTAAEPHALIASGAAAVRAGSVGHQVGLYPSWSAPREISGRGTLSRASTTGVLVGIGRPPPLGGREDFSPREVTARMGAVAPRRSRSSRSAVISSARSLRVRVPRVRRGLSPDRRRAGRGGRHLRSFRYGEAVRPVGASCR